jgi:hypothetical protein
VLEEQRDRRTAPTSHPGRPENQGARYRWAAAGARRAGPEGRSPSTVRGSAGTGDQPDRRWGAPDPSGPRLVSAPTGRRAIRHRRNGTTRRRRLQRPGRRRPAPPPRPRFRHRSNGRGADPTDPDDGTPTATAPPDSSPTQPPPHLAPPDELIVAPLSARTTRRSAPPPRPFAAVEVEGLQRGPCPLRAPLRRHRRGPGRCGRRPLRPRSGRWPGTRACRR